MDNAPSPSFSLRGSLESGGYVQHPLHVDAEPSLDEAKARCERLVAQMPSSTEWKVIVETPAPKAVAS